jgi:pimeloyl-ACP methyl ester carboxylesterase
VRVEPFEVRIGADVLDDLRRRIRATRWPGAAPGEPWTQGVDEAFLRDLLRYWADEFDWSAQERRLNRYEHRLAHLDDVRLHFVTRSGGGNRLRLLLLHGWPSTFLEMLALVDRLGDRFDLVVPSLPGYAFSSRPARNGVNRADVAEMCHTLMTGLGAERYGVHGADFGAGVATQLGLSHPDAVVGVHLSTAEMSPYVGPDTPPLSDAEQAYLTHRAEWDRTERGYSSVQSTRPQTLGYGLNDSPAGLAAWVLDTWRSWSDSDGDLVATFGRDALLTMLTIWWATGSITSSMRDYYDNRWHDTPLGRNDVVTVPTAFALFPNEYVPEGEPPRSWYERLYTIHRWSIYPDGGHFAAAEQPDVVAADIAAFFDTL